MGRAGNIADIILSAGFRVGFLIVFAGMILAYLPIIHAVVVPAIEFAGLLEALDALPTWLKLIITGLALMGAALIVHTGTYLVESVVEATLDNP
jgi:hypothetical protein